MPITFRRGRTVATLATALALAVAAQPSARSRTSEPGNRDDDRNPGVRHVLVISIDGMHALDFANCATGIPSVNGGEPIVAPWRSSRITG